MKKLIYICISIFAFSAVSIAQNQPAKASSFAEVRTGDEKFDRIFREGRDLIDKNLWDQAIGKFNQIICNCPDENKQADAALYWLAHCYKKMKKYDEASETLGKIFMKFPNSNWTTDAQIMRIEVNRLSGAETVAKITPAQSTANNLFQYYVQDQSGFGVTTSPKVSLDREDEIRLAAFQSLFANDPKKGIEALGRLLHANSKAGETLKREVLRSLRGSRFSGFRSSPTNSEVTPAILVTQINPMLRDTLAKSFQTESNANVRSEIIYSIANINDEASYNFLAQTYPNESNKDLKKAIINAFGGGNYAYIAQAYTPSGVSLGTTYAIPEYPRENLLTATTAQTQSKTNKSTTNPIRELRFNSLMTIFRNEKDLELRRLALGNIQRFSGWSNRDGMIDSLSQLYDSETDEKFKISIIYSFANLTKNAQATNKLLSIAKDDKSDKMRLEAIRALRNNNSPEVIKFLEDLIQ